MWFYLFYFFFPFLLVTIIVAYPKYNKYNYLITVFLITLLNFLSLLYLNMTSLKEDYNGEFGEVIFSTLLAFIVAIIMTLLIKRIYSKPARRKIRIMQVLIIYLILTFVFWVNFSFYATRIYYVEIIDGTYFNVQR